MLAIVFGSNIVKANGFLMDTQVSPPNRQIKSSSHQLVRPLFDAAEILVSNLHVFDANCKDSHNQSLVELAGRAVLAGGCSSAAAVSSNKNGTDWAYGLCRSSSTKLINVCAPCCGLFVARLRTLPKPFHYWKGSTLWSY